MSLAPVAGSSLAEIDCNPGRRLLVRRPHYTHCMFPSDHDIEAFKTEFGRESILERFAISRQSCCGTQAGVVITPKDTKDATLAHAWELVRSIARWILVRASELPPSERYEIIVGWSQTVRRLQGQVFKVGGDHAAVQTIADSAEWTQCGRAPLIRWEKDVFENRVAS